MPDSFQNNLPRRMRFGRGAALELPGELRRMGCSAPFIVTDRGVAAAGLLSRVTGALDQAGMRRFVFDGTEPEPPFSCVAAATDSARGAGFAADVVVALGGGSVMDTAKLVAATLPDGRQAHLLAGIGKVEKRLLPLVCVPTTSGTGSEATPVAIFTDPATGSKLGVVDPCLVPDLVLLDPELTDGLPALPTAAAGMDALVHALEAYIAKVATPLARGLAL
jgi:alcohol dehydrogenase class IV